jgi:glycine cleavage system regulatory protein
MKRFILSIIGDDKPGLVEAIASCVAAHGGNWQTSQLSHLAGKFAGIVLVTLPAAAAESLEADLKKLSESGLSVRVSDADGTAPNKPTTQVRLEVIGPDRPGIIREISQALAKRTISVVELVSDITPAPMTNEPLFQATIKIVGTESYDEDELLDTLDLIAEEMTVDIDLIKS